MPTSESEIEFLARAMIDRHGMDAARTAVIRLNQMIDQSDWDGRDRWACVVRAIHQNQGIVPFAFARLEPSKIRIVKDVARVA
jgi:hypothetical protein